MGKQKPTKFGEDSHTNQTVPPKADATSQDVRILSVDELSDLRRDVAESSTWAKAELPVDRSIKKFLFLVACSVLPLIILFVVV